MASTKTKVVSVRLRNEIAEWVAENNLKDIIENLYEGRQANSDGLLELSFLYDIDPQDLVFDVKEMLDNGTLMVKEGQLCSVK